MKNKIKNYIFIITLILMLSYFLQAQTTDSDESELKKFEVGGQITVLRQKSYEDNSPIFNVRFVTPPYFIEPLADNHQTEYGFGGRFTYNFNKSVAIEAEANFFPIDRLSVTGREGERIFETNEFFRFFVEPQGRKFQALAGPKIGYRWKKFGLFGKVRPGIFYVDRYPVIKFLSSSPPVVGITSAETKAVFFSTDVGGVVEFYPSKRTVLRFDIGDTIIVYKAKGIEPKQFNPGFTRHTFQFSTGFGFRF